MLVDLLHSLPEMTVTPSSAIVAFSEGLIGQHGQFFEATSDHTESQSTTTTWLIINRTLPCLPKTGYFLIDHLRHHLEL
jgi:hypothetical protein